MHRWHNIPSEISKNRKYSIHFQEEVFVENCITILDQGANCTMTIEVTNDNFNKTPIIAPHSIYSLYY
jgi:hypothetical protein